jgi:DNA-binding transcriptional MerR regulator/effector-binding domain-containing protein
MGGYMSIKEFSEMSGIAGSTLRFWDTEGLLVPAKRDEISGYRYYLSDQIFEARFIKFMSDTRVPRKTIMEIKDNCTPEDMDLHLMRQELLLGEEIRKLHDKQTAIFVRRKLIRQGSRVGAEDKISVVEREAVRCFIGPRNKYKIKGEGYFNEFVKFYRRADEIGFDVNYQIGGIHENWASFMEAAGEPTFFFSSDPSGLDEIPEGKYVVGYIRGPFGHLGDLPKRMDNYIKENNLKMTGKVDIIYLHDSSCIRGGYGEYLAQVCAQIK